MVFIRKKFSKIILSTNENLIIYDTQDKTDNHVKIPAPIIPDNLSKGQIQAIQKQSREITSIEFSKDGDYFVISTENKQVIVYDNKLQVEKNVIVNRAASKVCFTPSNDVVVADKTGDVYLYKLHTDDPPTLLLGHQSVILDITISECGKYIITCDRDEKIRVSCFPNAYNIVSFCLGHKEFVTKVTLVKGLLLSTSGDGTIRLWEFIGGKQLSMIDTNEHIDKDLLKSFAEEMDKEKVDVVALPITDMQICDTDKLYIAVSIYRYDAIQLYTADVVSFKCDYVAKLSVNGPFTFYFNGDLYVLCKDFLVFNVNNDQFIQCQSPYVEIYGKYKGMLSLDKDNSITGLYKRKFDNVKEYLERKKQRLQAK
ncbi:hypothetical protein NQ317_010619 [Molorchus minor]|uniref:tRNA (guanine-N(7)-)-methyltransferase non-catalytic subunit wuho n=1 Tax=Molorchus minor TaxID=1323400 RepID=A0ABQ9JD22_9CUCU|nr:hypothetical protein NQ317_010619 [Molorchus minor]